MVDSSSNNPAYDVAVHPENLEHPRWLEGRKEELDELGERLQCWEIKWGMTHEEIKN
jgi:hypothetical protein